MANLLQISKKILDKFHLPNWLVGLLILVFIIRVPSFFEPYYYGDEMIYLTLGQGLRHGLILYKDIFDNKPPLIYLLAAAAGSLVGFKIILLVFNVAAIILFWKLLKHLFPENSKLEKISTIIFALISSLPFLEGNIVNAEILMVTFILVAYYLFLVKGDSRKSLFVSGAFFSFAALLKIPAIFEIPVVAVYLLIVGGLTKQNLKSVISKLIFVSLGFITVLSIIVTWFYFQHALGDYIKAVFLQNIGYLSSWRPVDAKKTFIIRNGPLILRSLILILANLVIFVFRKKISKRFILVTIWLLFTLFAATLSERPYPHYLIQTLPPLSILFGIFIAETKIEQVYAILPLSLFFTVTVIYKFYFYPVSTYYLRFANVLLGKTSKEEYLSSFGEKVARNYKISQFLMRNLTSTEKVFIWGDSPGIYALSRRLPSGKYTASYHLKDYSTPEQVIDSLYISKPRLVVILPEENSFPELRDFLFKNYILLSNYTNDLGVEIWHIRQSAK